MTQAQASAEVPVIEITKEGSSIKFHVNASVGIDGTFDKWDATATMTSPDVETAVLDVKIQAPQDAPHVISDQDLGLLRKDIRSQRKQLIASNLNLTDQEATKFWRSMTSTYRS